MDRLQIDELERSKFFKEVVCHSYKAEKLCIEATLDYIRCINKMLDLKDKKVEQQVIQIINN
jgi:hypothetical protein